MKTLKKLFTILAIILVAIIALAPAKSLAADGDLTITVTGDVAGRTLSVYKLFDLTVTGTEEKPIYNYTWAEGAEEFFAGLTDADGLNLGLTTVAKATDYLKGFENDSTALTKIAEKYYAYCQQTGISAIAKTTVAADATDAVFTVPGQGYYLIYDETGTVGTGRAIAAAMLSNVTENTTVALKAEKTTVEKEADKATAAVGETVNYTVTSKVPNVVGYDSYTFVVTDTLSKGLTLNENSINVTIGGETYTAWTKNIVNNGDGTTTLTVTFNSTEFAGLTDKIGEEIKVTYSATLNKDAATILDNTNEVKITYSNDPKTDGKGETTPDIVHVYTYKIDFTKKNTAGETLPGAKFVLKLADGTFATFDDNGVFTGTVATQEEATELVSDANGKIAISGLKAGSYTLIETEAPADYSIPNFEFTFTIRQDLEDGTLTATFDYTADVNNTAAKGYMTDSTSTSASFAIDVLNAKEGSLPTTGGIGTTIFTVVGIAVMAVAVVAFVAHNRKND